MMAAWWLAPHHGTFTREGSKIQIYFTDATNTGVVNFVIWDADVLTKDSELFSIGKWNQGTEFILKRAKCLQVNDSGEIFGYPKHKQVLNEDLR